MQKEISERLVRVSELIDSGAKPKFIMDETNVSRSEVMAAMRWTRVFKARGYRLNKTARTPA